MDRGTGYDLKVTENGKRKNTAIWRITPIDNQRCILTITSGMNMVNASSRHASMAAIDPLRLPKRSAL